MARLCLFMGEVRPLAPENRPSGIFKQAATGPVWLGREGLAGDAQADRRVHGGPEKALHQYPVEHYARLGALFPDIRDRLLPGTIGENLSVPGWEESTVCIGDRFRLGEALLEVSCPRSPCWKIDRRYDCEGLAQAIERTGLCGWYFRVLEEGEVTPECSFERVECGSVTLGELLALWSEHRPDPERLASLASTPGLAGRWVEKLSERAMRLRELAQG